MQASIVSDHAVPGNETGREAYPAAAGNDTGEMFSRALADVLLLFSSGRAGKPPSQDVSGKGKPLAKRAGAEPVAGQSSGRDEKAVEKSPGSALQKENPDPGVTGVIKAGAPAAEKNQLPAGPVAVGREAVEKKISGATVPGAANKTAGTRGSRTGAKPVPGSNAGDRAGSSTRAGPGAAVPDGKGSQLFVEPDAGTRNTQAGATGAKQTGAGQNTGNQTGTSIANLTGAMQEPGKNPGGRAGSSTGAKPGGTAPDGKGSQFFVEPGAGTRNTTAPGGPGAAGPKTGRRTGNTQAGPAGAKPVPGSNAGDRAGSSTRAGPGAAAPGTGSVPVKPGGTAPDGGGNSGRAVPAESGTGGAVPEKAGVWRTAGSGQQTGSRETVVNQGQNTSGVQETALPGIHNPRPETVPLSAGAPDGAKGTSLPELKGRLLQEVRNFINHKDGTQTQVQLKLEPEKLGHLTIRLYFQQGELNAHFYTGNEQVKEMLEGSLQQLKSSLNQLDLNLNQALVFVNNGGREQHPGRYLNEKNRYGRTAYRGDGRGPETGSGAVNPSGGISQVDYLV
jgi:hypothetical protein